MRDPLIHLAQQLAAVTEPQSVVGALKLTNVILLEILMRLADLEDRVETRQSQQ